MRAGILRGRVTPHSVEAKELAMGFESPLILTLSTFTGAPLLCIFTTADADASARAGCGNKGPRGDCMLCFSSSFNTNANHTKTGTT